MLKQSLAGINQLAQREQKRGKVFGVPHSMVEGFNWLDHQPTSESGFITAVCHADFAVATPGNQFMAETLKLGIPVLMTPTPKQFEQEINAKIQIQARPLQYAMFHPEAKIPESPQVHHDTNDTSGRSKAVAQRGLAGNLAHPLASRPRLHCWESFCELSKPPNPDNSCGCGRRRPGFAATFAA